MNNPVEVLVPLVNPNEPESLLSALLVKDGDRVAKGQVIASFETTKSTYDLTAASDGYIIGLKCKVGETLRAGERLCAIADSAAHRLTLEPAKKPVDPLPSESDIPDGLRITNRARMLAEEQALDLSLLPKGVLVTEEMVRELLSVQTSAVNPGDMLIYGGGGHAKSLIDLVRLAGEHHIRGILDDGIPAGTNIMGIPVLGGGELLPGLYRSGVRLAVNAVGGIGSITPRLVVYEKLAAAGFECLTVIHPHAFVEPSANLAAGCQVFFNAYVGSEVNVGFGSIINTGAIISHDCQLGEYVNISPGAILAGAVLVGDRALVGMGVTINLGVRVGAGARIGNSAVVKTDVPENGIVRAGATWPEN